MKPLNRTRPWLLSLCLVLLMAPQAGAETLPSRVVAAQTPDGAKVEIVLTSGEKVKGRLYGVSRDGVTVISGKGAQAVQPVGVNFDEMKSFKQRPATLKNLLAGVGVAATFMVMVTAVALGM